MHNSQSYVPVPQGPSSKGFTPIKKPVNYDLDVALKRSAKDSSAGEAHRTKRRRDILSLAKEDRERLEALPRGIVRRRGIRLIFFLETRTSAADEAESSRV
jgi:hypothetical protein